MGLIHAVKNGKMTENSLNFVCQRKRAHQILTKTCGLRGGLIKGYNELKDIDTQHQPIQHMFQEKSTGHRFLWKDFEIISHQKNFAENEKFIVRKNSVCSSRRTCALANNKMRHFRAFCLHGLLVQLMVRRVKFQKIILHLSLDAEYLK